MKLIVGLGNPEKKYDNTRHNVGFMALDYYSKRSGVQFKSSTKLNGLVYKDKDFVLLKPTTYMNNSGFSVKKALDYYKVDVSDLLVIVDDFNIPFANLRLRLSGSAGGHNGLKSIQANISTENYKRARIGLGNIDHNAIDFVLGEFSKEEIKRLESEVFERTNAMIDEFIKGNSFDIIMNKYNESKK